MPPPPHLPHVMMVEWGFLDLATLPQIRHTPRTITLPQVKHLIFCLLLTGSLGPWLRARRPLHSS